MREDKLGISEYQEVLLDNVSNMIVSQDYIEENKEFFDNVIFKMFEVYSSSLETVSIRNQAKILEIFLGMMEKFKPSQENLA